MKICPTCRGAIPSHGVVYSYAGRWCCCGLSQNYQQPSAPKTPSIVPMFGSQEELDRWNRLHPAVKSPEPIKNTDSVEPIRTTGFIAPVQKHPVALLPHQERVAKEWDELTAKIEALAKFCKTETHDLLPVEERYLFSRQMDYMIGYASILKIRVKGFTRGCCE